MTFLITISYTDCSFRSGWLFCEMIPFIFEDFESKRDMGSRHSDIQKE